MATAVEPDEFFNPLNPAHIADPDALMQASRRGCPVGQVSDILYAVHADEAVREVFGDTTHFSSRGNFTVGVEDVQLPFAMITTADPPVHTALRARLLKDLSPARLRKMNTRVEAIVQECVSALPKSGFVDLYESFVQFIPARILYALIGIPESDWSQVQNWSDVIVATLPNPAHELPEFQGLTGYLGGLIEGRRSQPNERHEDVLDNLCFADPDEQDMSTPEVISHLLQLLGAATDTTRALIVNCLFRLLENRDQWEAVATDRSLLPNAIEESLRMDSPLQFMVRTAVQPVTIGACPIEPGKKVYVNIQSANHDEQRWGVESLTYQADRPHASGHLAFGRGIHACIGAPLARIEARVAIAALLDAYPHMALDPAAEWLKCEGAMLRRAQTLPVLLTGEQTP